MATFTIVKSDNQVSINDYVDQFPQDYDVFIDELNDIVVIRSGDNARKWEIKTLVDTITVNGDAFTGTAAQLKALLFSSVFVQASSGGGSVVGFPEGTKMYWALLTQTGENAPVATVLNNTLGGTLVWTRSSAGVYVGTLEGAFPDQDKFYGQRTAYLNLGDGVNTFVLYRNSSDEVKINTFSVADVDLVDLLQTRFPVKFFVAP